MKRIIVWGIIFLSLVTITYCYADKLSSYSSTSTLSSSAIIPVVDSSTNYNVNWSTLKGLISSGINWTDVKTIGIKYGDHSGINWQSFGA